MGVCMKKVVICILISGLLAAPAFAKKAPPAPPPLPSEEVIAAERAFDAFTAEHGFNAGFHEYSAPDALTFGPAPERTHDTTAAALAATPNEPPSQLRWWPARLGISSSGDLAYDLGGWTYGDNSEGGWFFTVWQKQTDGSWKWLIDTRAGSGPVDALPPKQPTYTDFIPHGTSDSPGTAAGEMMAADITLNKALTVQTASTAYNGFLVPPSIVSQESGAPAQTLEARLPILDARPQGLAWTSEGQGVSKAGDFGYTWGHAATDDHNATIQGYYIRVWRKDGPNTADWHIIADIYHPVKPAT